MAKVRILNENEDINKFNNQTTIINIGDAGNIVFELDCEYIWDTILHKLSNELDELLKKYNNQILINEETINNIIRKAVDDELMYIVGTFILDNLSIEQIVKEIQEDEDKLENIMLDLMSNEVIEKIKYSITKL